MSIEAGGAQLPARECKPRICQVAVTPHRSGTEQILLDLSARFVRDGAEVTIVIPTGADALDIMATEACAAGASVRRVPPLYPGNRDRLGNLRRLVVLFRGLRPDIVHYHIPRAFSGFETVLAGWLAHVRRRIRTDQNPIAYPPTRLQRLRLHLADTLVDRIVCVSQGNLRNHLEQCGRPARRCLVIPNGIDVATVNDDHSLDRRRRLRVAMSLPADGPIAVMVAWLSYRKGGLDFVEAAATASSIAPALRYAVIGEGPYLERIKARAIELGLTDRLYFLGARTDVREVLCAFDMFVLPSHYEGLALTMLEALAAGLPMVATRVEGVSDVFPDGRGALLVERFDTAGLGRAMAQLSMCPNLATELAAIGRERVRAAFTVEATYAKYRALYASLGLFGS